MFTKTIIPRIPGLYSSFPTMVTDENNLYIYYRQGKADPSQVHGLDGRVRHFEISKELLMEKLSDPEDLLYSWGIDQELDFHSDNELDSICSNLGEGLYSLATRNYVAGKINQPYISFSQNLNFLTRDPVKFSELQSLVFYGQAFSSPIGYIFPAYGRLQSDLISRPLLLITEDKKSFRILAKIPSKINGEIILNEHSIVYHNNEYISFIRQDSRPFGIWVSRSVDLLTWSKPESLVEKAHAPIALKMKGKIFLAYRDLSEKGLTKVRLCTPFDGNFDLILDNYPGNPYDGGYVSLCQAEDYLLATYYLGNEQGEPYIKLAAVNV